ncbi:MAG: HAD-IIIA family hydrolase [Betaproteobacteria bacterium]
MNKAEVVILAGGFGNRLSKVLPEGLPKPMAPFLGKPLLFYQLDLCRRCGVSSVLILTHHLSEVIESSFGDGSHLGLRISYLKEDVPRGTAGAVKDALPLLEDSFIVIYGDTFLEVDLGVFRSQRRKDVSLLTLVHPNSHPYDSDLLTIDDGGLVTGVFRPTRSGDTLYSNNVNAALYYAEAALFDEYVPDSGAMDISSELFPVAIGAGARIQAYSSVEYIKDMGTPDRYNGVQADLLRGVPQRLALHNKRACVFLDRDGVINQEDGYIISVDQFRLLPRVSEAISLLNRAGVLVICVTNQPIIARGDASEESLNNIHMRMEVDLGKQGAYLDAIYYCPHHPDSGFDGEVSELKITCECRKPSPGMILRAAEEFNIDLESSWIVGDTWRDMAAGEAAGIKTAYVGKPDSSISADYRGKDVLHATEHILEMEGW